MVDFADPMVILYMIQTFFIVSVFFMLWKVRTALTNFNADYLNYRVSEMATIKKEKCEHQQAKKDEEGKWVCMKCQKVLK